MNHTVKELQILRPWYVGNSDNRSNANDRNNFRNDGRFVRIALTAAKISIMKTHKRLWEKLCSYENLFFAYKKARKHKTTKDYVVEFEKNLENNLLLLRSELLLHCYEPKPLVNFIIRDPKTRKISKSDFKDRVVHHALCNIIEPIFEKSFIYDSFANRVGKGMLKAIQRFDFFKRKVSKNNTVKCYVLKADIKKYFENVDHEILLSAIKKKITDKKVIWLIRKILANSSSQSKGMPLGNLTSQFFANVYLNEFDWFLKTNLKVKHYIRYVDDFVILSDDKYILEEYALSITTFLSQNLAVELHHGKSRILEFGNSFSFLGFRVFYYHKLLKKSNLRTMKAKLSVLTNNYAAKMVDYDVIYDFLEGWIAYAKNANTYKLRKNLLGNYKRAFPNEISTKEINRLLKKYRKLIPSFSKQVIDEITYPKIEVTGALPMIL